MSETSAVVRPLLDALEAAGVYADRNQAGKVKVRGGWMQLHKAGTPDVGGHLEPSGRAYFVECKLGKGKERESQQAWREMAVARGALVLLCHDPQAIPGVVATLLRAQRMGGH